MATIGEKFVFAVAQRPFDQTGNRFATVAPVLRANGERVSPDEFPNRGLCWWMVRAPFDARLAEPGTLIVGEIEHAPRFTGDDPDKDMFQIRLDSARIAGPEILIETLTVADGRIAELRDLVNARGVITVEHPPTPLVLVRWRGSIVGPFRATAAPSSSMHGGFDISLDVPASSPSSIRIDQATLTRTPGYIGKIAIEVALEDAPVSKAGLTNRCTYELLTHRALETLQERANERIELQKDEIVLGRLAKLVFNNTKRKQLLGLLKELQDELVVAGHRLETGPAQLLTLLDRTLNANAAVADTLVDAVLTAERLQARLEAGIDRRTARYVDEHAARLGAEAAGRVAALGREVAALEARQAQLKAEIEGVERRERARVDSELQARRAAAEQEIAAERQALAALKADLARQQAALTGNLRTVTDRFLQGRDQIINEFLSLQPLLVKIGVLPDGVPPDAAVSAAASAPRAGAPELTFPSYVRALEPTANTLIGEAEFFDRFARHAAARGFAYRRIDLAAFHMSIKCGDLTVLGGISGTGKSSLPRLYAEALAGEDPAGAERYLHVAVSPAWLNMGDLLGHVNLLERRFQPSESGLFRHLAYAAEEHRHKSDDSGLYLVCLDEMNLAQVEFYFSGFLQALEQPEPARAVRAFDADGLSPDDPARTWALLPLPQSVRFVGTVNFDETTKQLSQRTLDRANLIRVQPDRLVDMARPPWSGAAACAGAPVTLRAFRAWARSASLPSRAGEIIDRLRQPLQRLGCPITPRRFRAICAFLASAPPEICAPSEALDLQVAQRLLPQIRGLFRPQASEALDQIEQVLTEEPAAFPEALRVLGELRADDPGALPPESDWTADQITGSA